MESRREHHALTRAAREGRVAVHMISTNEQAAALTATAHTMLVAKAGAGKTTTVVAKILWLLGEDVGTTEDGVAIPRCENPCTLQEIAAITFTEKAAYDLKRK